MSLINQMLQDLDKRRASASEVAPLPAQVRSLPQDRGGDSRLVVGGLGTLLLAGGVGGWLFFGPGFTTPPVAPPVATVIPSSLPAPPAVIATPVSAQLAAVDTVAQEVQQRPKLPAERAGGLRLDANLATPSPAIKDTPSRMSTGEGAPQAVKTSAPVAGSAAAPAAIGGKVIPAPAPVPVTTAAAANGSGPASIDKQPRLGTPRERAEQEYRRGVAALNLGRLVDAQGALRSALKEDAAYQEARQLLLKLLVEQRNLEEARQLLAEGLAVVPSQVSWIMTLARLQIEAGDAKAAWATLEAGLPYARNSSEYQGFAGGVLHRLQRESEAADAYRAALRLAPNDGRWWLGLGLALEAGGAAGEARQAFQNARASGSLSPEMTAFVDQRLR